YLRPTPPPESGYHRYQFLLYEQPAHEDVSLNPDETASSGEKLLCLFVSSNEKTINNPAAWQIYLGDIYTFHCMSIENEWRRNSQAERQIMVADV
ncbi:hypothetical protein E2320_006909, partial [Naja naja]